MVDDFADRLPSFVLFSLIVPIKKFLIGSTHALLHDYYETQMFVLIGIELAAVLTLVFF